MASPPDSTSSTHSQQAAETPEERLKRLVAAFRSRLSYLTTNYANCLHDREGRGTYNESLAAIRRTLDPKARSKPPKMRVHHEIELLINHWAMGLALSRGSNSGITQEDVNAAGQRLIKELKPRRGRPGDDLLTFHVQALMALCRQTTGSDLRSSRTKNSVYEPHIVSLGAATYLEIFRRVDPTVTMTRLANIIRSTHTSGAIIGKRFEDFFPFYGGRVDPGSGEPIAGPGFKLEHFELMQPIYCS